MTRTEHLEWCKKRAHEELARDDSPRGLANALASMMSDLKEHTELANHAGIELGAMLLLGGHLSHPHEVKRFIDGFN